VGHPYNALTVFACRDVTLLARKDNIVIFVTQDGEPCDDGSHLLAKDNKVPVIKDATLGRARVIKRGRRYLIALVTKTRASALLEKEILKEALRSLYDVTLELNLRTISLFKTDVDYVSWANVKKFLRELFDDSPTKIIVCDNRVTIPEPSERDKCYVPASKDRKRVVWMAHGSFRWTRTLKARFQISGIARAQEIFSKM
jgi:hypothetical protein